MRKYQASDNIYHRFDTTNPFVKWHNILSNDWPICPAILPVDAYTPSDQDSKSWYFPWRSTDSLERWNENIEKQEYSAEFGYHQNAHGYRCDEFEDIMNRPTKKLLTLGCSNTYGVGVPEEHTWPQMLKSQFEHRKNEKIDVINLGAPGGSNQLIDVYLNWCHRFKPDYIAVLLAPEDRKLAIDENGIMTNLGPWNTRDSVWSNQMPDAPDYNNRQEMSKFIEAHYLYVEQQLKFETNVVVNKLKMIGDIGNIPIAYLFPEVRNLHDETYFRISQNVTPEDWEIVGNPTKTHIGRDGAHPGSIFYLTVAKEFFKKLNT
jgi:hypothetical protein